MSALLVRRSSSGAVVPDVELAIRPRLRTLGARIGTGGDIFTVRVPDEATAQRLVELLGFGPGGLRVRVRVASPERRLLHVPIAAVAYATGLAVIALVGTALPIDGLVAYLYGIPASAIAGLVAHELLKAASRAPEAAVGTDGVALRKGFHRTFLARTEVAFTDDSAVAEERRPSDLKRKLGGPLVDGERCDAVVRLAGEGEHHDSGAPSRLATYSRAGRTPSRLG